MKHTFVICLALALFACEGSKTRKGGHFSFRDISTELGDSHASMLTHIRETHRFTFEGRSPEEVEKNPFNKFYKDMEGYEFARLPYYRFDNAQFHENPGEENLQKCIKPSEDMNIVAVKDGQIPMRMLVRQTEDGWSVPGLTLDYGKTIGWLKDSLYRAGTQDYKIFVFGRTREFVTYKKDGKDLYFKITGEPFTANQLCEFFVDEYNNAQRTRKYIKEHPEQFKRAEGDTSTDSKWPAFCQHSHIPRTNEVRSTHVCERASCVSRSRHSYL